MKMVKSYFSPCWVWDIPVQVLKLQIWRWRLIGFTPMIHFVSIFLEYLRKTVTWYLLLIADINNEVRKPKCKSIILKNVDLVRNQYWLWCILYANKVESFNRCIFKICNRNQSFLDLFFTAIISLICASWGLKYTKCIIDFFKVAWTPGQVE